MKLTSALAMAAAAMTLATNTPRRRAGRHFRPRGRQLYLARGSAQRSRRSIGCAPRTSGRWTLLAGDPPLRSGQGRSAGDLRQRGPDSLCLDPPGRPLQFLAGQAESARGLVRRTTLESYRSDDPEWETVLDVDALAEGRRARMGLQRLRMPATRRAPVHDFAVRRGRGCHRAARIRHGDQELRRQRLRARRKKPGRDPVGRSGHAPRQPRFSAKARSPRASIRALRVSGSAGRRTKDAQEIWRGEEADVWSAATLLRDHTGTAHGYYAFRATSFHETEYYWQKDGEWLPSRHAAEGLALRADRRAATVLDRCRLGNAGTDIPRRCARLGRSRRVQGRS